MTLLYESLRAIAQEEFPQIVLRTKIIGKRTIGSSKLRLFLKDQTFLDVWLSPSGKYSYHWEQRAKRGIIYRFDNAPDHPHLKTFPKHLHFGNEKTIRSSNLPDNPASALRGVLAFINEKMK